jgi:hypothetical protein
MIAAMCTPSLVSGAWFGALYGLVALLVLLFLLVVGFFS